MLVPSGRSTLIRPKSRSIRFGSWWLVEIRAAWPIDVIAKGILVGCILFLASATMSSDCWPTHLIYSGSTPLVASSGPHRPMASGPECWWVAMMIRWSGRTLFLDTIPEFPCLTTVLLPANRETKSQFGSDHPQSVSIWQKDHREYLHFFGCWTEDCSVIIRLAAPAWSCVGLSDIIGAKSISKTVDKIIKKRIFELVSFLLLRCNFLWWQWIWVSEVAWYPRH